MNTQPLGESSLTYLLIGAISVLLGYLLVSRTSSLARPIFLALGVAGLGVLMAVPFDVATYSERWTGLIAATVAIACATATLVAGTLLAKRFGSADIIFGARTRAGQKSRSASRPARHNDTAMDSGQQSRVVDLSAAEQGRGKQRSTARTAHDASTATDAESTNRSTLPAPAEGVTTAAAPGQRKSATSQTTAHTPQATTAKTNGDTA